MRLPLAFALWVGIAPFWTPSVMVGSRPTAIVRDFATGALRYEACQGSIGPGSSAVIIHAEAAGTPACCQPCEFEGPVTLSEWCAALRALPEPPKVRPSDPSGLYSGFQGRGVCP